MSVNTADMHKGINAAWAASDLDDVFLALRADPTDESTPVLNDQEAAPSEKFPYCVFGEIMPSRISQMSGGVSSIRQIRGVSVQFNVHASTKSGDSRSAKQIAAYLSEEIIKVFGGHPTVSPTQSISLDNGNVVSMDYQNDYGIREDDSQYKWIISYEAMIDVPVMV